MPSLPTPSAGSTPRTTAYTRMFYVYHTGHASTDDPRVVATGPERIAEMVVEAELVGWVVRKKHLLRRLVEKVLIQDRYTFEVWYRLPRFPGVRTLNDGSP